MIGGACWPLVEVFTVKSGSSAQIGTVWRDWHRLEDGHCGFWAMRCRQVVSMPPRGVDRGGIGS